jgi:hypothetical protein
VVALSGLLAYALIAAALGVSDGKFDPVALGLMLAGFGVTLAGSCLRGSPRLDSVAGRVVPRLLFWIVAGELAGLFVLRPGIYVPPGPAITWFRLGVLVLGLFALNYGTWRFLPGAWVFPAVVVVHFLLGALIVRASPRPFIDVWYFQQEACQNLVGGTNPYAAEYPNIYRDARLYGEGVLKNNRIQSFFYPPLSILLVLPGYLLGDVRWALLLAQEGAAALLVVRGRRLGLPAGHPAELPAVVLLCHPCAFFLLEQAWTEPLLALAISACAWTLAGRRRAGFGLALAMLLSVKQYALLWLPCLGADKLLRPRDLLVALGGSALVALPFVVWDWQALWYGVVTMQFLQPFREDALSVPAAVFALTGWRLSSLAGFLAAAGAAALVVWRSVPTLAHAALAGAAVFLAFFLFNKQAFLNYYWFTQALLCLAVSASFVPTRPTPGGGPARIAEAEGG